MSVSANGFAKTEKASRYLQQLCKHWEHNLKVEFSADHGTIVFPKSVDPGRIRENIDVFDIELAEEDRATIDELATGERMGPDPERFG